MATVVLKTMTAEQFFDWRLLPENRYHYRDHELENGEIIQFPREGDPHHVIGANSATLLLRYAQQRGKGDTRYFPGLIVRRDPDTVRAPDVAFYDEGVPFEQKPLDFFWKLSPILVVEILSPTDHWRKMLRRITDYLTAGIPMAWLIDPDDRSIIIFRQRQIPIFLEQTDILTGMDVLPELRCNVSDFFPPPGYPRSYP